MTQYQNLDILGRGGLFWYSHLHDQLRGAKDYVGSLEAPSLRLDAGIAGSAGLADLVSDASIAPHIRKSAAKL